MSAVFCPCMRLQTGVKLLSIIDALLTLLFVVVCVVTLVTVLNFDDQKLEGLKLKGYKNLLVAMVVLDMIVSILQFILDIILYNAAIKRSWAKCFVWLVVTGITLTKYIYNIAKNSTLPGFSASAYVYGILFFIFKLYEMVVVFSFIQQVRKQPSTEVEDINSYPAAAPMPIGAISQNQPYDPNGMQFSYDAPQYQAQYQNQYQNNVYSNV
ncbi:unnamed protein product [Orchesella dallaii]|uniref:Uncharacterized protein n=1 Tax=Orchesella dallaii TaxID=48710 RepID=A0ABP1QC82_9HEXA